MASKSAGFDFWTHISYINQSPACFLQDITNPSIIPKQFSKPRASRPQLITLTSRLMATLTNIPTLPSLPKFWNFQNFHNEESSRLPWTTPVPYRKPHWKAIYRVHRLCKARLDGESFLSFHDPKKELYFNQRKPRGIQQ